MQFITNIVFVLSLLATATTGMDFSPSPTHTLARLVSPAAAQNAVAPLPTLGPSADELRKRVSPFTQGMVVAPDSICGWLSGFSAASDRFGCPTSATCVFNTIASAIGCYEPPSPVLIPIGAVSSCIEWSSLGGICSTAGSCTNPSISYCTSALYPYCNIGYFANFGISVTYCGKTVYSTHDVYETTYIGESGGTFSTVGAAITSTTSSSTSSTPSLTSSTTTHSTDTPTPTPTPAPASKSNTGAIVGGTVGGVAVIALVFTALFFILRRRRNSAQASSNEQPPPAFSTNPATGGYDPYGAGVGGTIPVEEKPQQQQGFVNQGYQPVSPQSGQYLHGSPDPQSARPYSEITEVSSPALPHETYQPYVDPSVPGPGGPVYHEKA